MYDEDYEEPLSYKPNVREQVRTKIKPNVDTESEHTMSLAKYMLSTDIPENVRKEFEYLFLLFDKDYALANLLRKDLPYFNSAYEFVTLLLECGLNEYARESMVQVIQDLKLTRSVDALQLKLGITGVQRSETVSRIEQNRIKRSLGNRIGEAVRGRSEVVE